MKMFHKDSKEPVDVHPSQVETMKNRGWTEKQPSKNSTTQPKKPE